MINNKAASTDQVSAAVQKAKGVSEGIRGGGVFTVVCYDKDGNHKWTAKSPNLVVNVGLADMNDKYFSGSGYSATWYLGLYGAASSNNPAAGDTMASHAGWTEVTDYSQSTRPAATFGSATVADPSVIDVIYIPLKPKHFSTTNCKFIRFFHHPIIVWSQPVWNPLAFSSLIFSYIRLRFMFIGFSPSFSKLHHLFFVVFTPRSDPRPAYFFIFFRILFLRRFNFFRVSSGPSVNSL